jgi:hydroxyacylglutathione hydrolase
VCDSAYAASLAVGLLERLGFKKVGCLDGGRDTWAEAGLPAGDVAVQADKTPAAPAPHHLPKRVVRLPQRISPADLKRSLEDLPETFELVDIRPAKGFEEFNLPGSINVDVAEVMQNPIYLRGTGPLILVDRDGSLAMAVGASSPRRPGVPSRYCTAAWRPMPGSLASSFQVRPLPSPNLRGKHLRLPGPPAANRGNKGPVRRLGLWREAAGTFSRGENCM